MSFTPGSQRLNGSFGFLQVDGEDWAEVTAVEVRVEAVYTDVQRGMDVDAKLTGRRGTGTLTTLKACTRARDWLTALQQGKDAPMRLVAWVSDPDTPDGQEERIAIENLRFTAADVFRFEHGKLIQAKFPFRFNPGDLKFLDTIQ